MIKGIGDEEILQRVINLFISQFSYLIQGILKLILKEKLNQIFSRFFLIFNNVSEKQLSIFHSSKTLQNTQNIIIIMIA